MDSGLHIADPVATRQRMRDAFERKDSAAAAAILAPDVVLHSPILGSPAFEGREAVGHLMAAVMTTFDDLVYTVEGDSGPVQSLAFSARVRGREIEAVDLFRIDDAGLVTEITIHIRPLAGLAAVAAALGPHLARGPVQRILITALAAPLTILLSVAEAITPRLIRMR
jgi:SnoaL-like protein